MEIKPCPFCGSEAIIMKTESIYWEAYQVLCDGALDGDCAGLEGSPHYDEEQYAIEKWNKRV